MGRTCGEPSEIGLIPAGVELGGPLAYQRARAPRRVRVRVGVRARARAWTRALAPAHLLVSVRVCGGIRVRVCLPVCPHKRARRQANNGLKLPREFALLVKQAHLSGFAIFTP